MSQQEEIQVPEEFSKVIGDFVNDIQRTFPEYTPLMGKWWKNDTQFSHIDDEDEREKQISHHKDARVIFLYKFAMKKYPPRFFEILNQDENMFAEESDVDTEFLPFIHFKNVWNDDISESTQQTIWSYLKLILFSVVNSVKDKDAFGDTAKLFEDMDEDDFKAKLDSALDDIKGIFENSGNDESGSGIPQPNTDDIHSHLSGMFTGKLGDLAREIAEETAGELNIEEDGETDVKEVFNKMFKNPGQLMGLVQNVGSKLEDKMKSGDISEAELMKEASEMLGKMKNVPGMGDIQSMMSKMGMNLGGAKLNTKGMEARMNQQMKKEQAKENVRKQAAMNRMRRETAANEVVTSDPPKYTDEELINMMNGQEKDEKAEVPKKKSNKKKKKKKTT
tara:strand:+ start:13761 stop:14933 length:1173 start_codon:yes stop_codon:yes gene_type:complete